MSAGVRCDDAEHPLNPGPGRLPLLSVPDSRCLATVDRLGWSVPILALRAGDHVLGVRTSHPRLTEWLGDWLASRVVDGVKADRNLSLWLAPKTAHGVQDLHRLYRTFVAELRSRSIRRSLTALAHELDCRDARSAGRLQIEATVLVRDGEAHLLPGELRRAVVGEQRSWEQHGVQLLERRQVELDLRTATVIIPELLAAEDAVSALIDELDLDGDGTAPVPGGRYPIASWTLDTARGTAAARGGQAASQVVDRARALTPDRIVGLSRLAASVADHSAACTDLATLRHVVQTR